MCSRPLFYIVLGPYRSGTSLISRIVQKLGANPGPEGELFEPTDWNPSGYIQRPDITAFNTKLITDAGGSLSEPLSPEIIAERTNPEVFSELDLTWTLSPNNPLIKDPRFCFTLLTWQKNGVFKNHQLAVVRITRGLESNIASALTHYDVKNYCGNNATTASKVLSAYDTAACWHEKNLNVPCYNIEYEKLISNSAEEIKRLADFMGIGDEKRIQSAIRASLEGKSRVSHDISG
jgi:hypothetical protein